MPRPKWKGKPLLNLPYNSAVKQDDLAEGVSLPTVRLYRRNVQFSDSAKQFFIDREFELYTGYDFIKRTLDKKAINYNLSTLVNTREINVVHKTKQTKHQRKNAAQQGAKKKLINTSKMKNKMKSKMKNKMKSKKK